jgi:predicted DsbA family dithiol-disulfide isomerase
MLRKNCDIEVRWTAFPLHPETPEQGLFLEELFAGRSFDVKAAMQRIKQVADRVGLPMAERTKTYNSRLAQELAKWAESKGMGDQYHQAVFQAYYVGIRNIGEVDELVGIAEFVGLSGKEARFVLEKRTFSRAVDADWTRSRELGIRAVPTFVMNNRSIVGAQSYEVLEEFIKDETLSRNDG